MILFSIVILIVISLWPLMWFRTIRNRLHVAVHLSQHYVGIGEAIPLTVVIENHALFPCPFIRVSVELPPGLSAVRDARESVVRTTLFLWMRQQAKVVLPVFGFQRGLQQLSTGQVTLQMNEGFGLRDLFISRNITGDIIVLPRISEESPPEIEWKELSGKLELMRWLHPDESLLRGIREYKPGDPYKHLAWNASARTGTWMTKQFSSSTEATVTILLNAQFFVPHWSGTRGAEFDALCELISSFAFHMHQRGYRFVFASNCTMPRDPKRRWHGNQRPEGLRMLLGRAFPYTNGPFEELLWQCVRQTEPHSPVVVFTSFLTDKQWAILHTMRQRGFDITIVAGPGATGVQRASFSGIQVIQPTVSPSGHASHPDDGLGLERVAHE